MKNRGHKFFNLVRNAETQSADLLIFGVIGWDVDAKELTEQVMQLRADGVKNLNVYINSPGGSVFDGIAIYNAIRMLNTTVYVYGLAASMGSVIALGGKKVIMAPQSYFMVHNPWTISFGEQEDLQKDAALLGQIKQTIISAYKTKSKLNDDELSELMNAETWMDADAALNYGFVDEIMSEEHAQQGMHSFVNMVANALADKFGIKNFQNIEDNDMKLSKEALQALGLSEDATEQEINDAIVAQTTDEPEPEETPEPEQPNAYVAGQLTDLIETLHNKVNQLAQEIADMKSGTETQRAAEIENLVNQAVADYKIPAKDKENWTDNLTANFDKYAPKLAGIPRDSVKPGKVEPQPEAPKGETGDEDPKIKNRRAFIAKVRENIANNE